MATIRISEQQKRSLLILHFIEIQHGLNTPVETNFLRVNVEKTLAIELYKNHYLTGLKKLRDNDYLVGQLNRDQSLSQRAYNNEWLWQLTEKGRAYAETLHSARLAPKRAYRR